MRPDASSVLTFVSQTDAENRGRASRCVAPRLCTFLDRNQQFVGVVDTFVSSRPTIAALVWGCIKTAILTASNVASYFDKITSMLMNLSRSCPTYQQFGLLYRDSTNLQSALCEYYAVIIRLCSKIVHVKERTGLEQVLSSIFNPFEYEFKSYHADLEIAAQNVSLQISLASQQANNDTAKLLAQDRVKGEARWLSTLRFHNDSKNEHQLWRSQEAARESAKMRSIIRANLAGVDHVKPWKQAMRQRISGTADLFHHNPDFRGWEEDMEAAVLWVSGTLGAGKTVLVSNIVAYLHRQRSESDLISYFFCRSDYEDSLRAKVIIGNIAYQLLESRI